MTPSKYFLLIDPKLDVVLRLAKAKDLRVEVRAILNLCLLLL